MPNESAKTVIVVEDDADTRANLSDILELDGYDVHPVGTFSEALAQQDDRSVVAIIADRQLPDGVAEDRIPQLRAAYPRAAIIAVTGYPDIESAIATLKQGADDYLLKPVNADALRTSLARILDQRHTREELRETRDRLRAILDTAADAIITIDSRGLITDVNAATQRLFGYSEQELVGQNVKMLMPSPYHEEYDRYLANYLATGRAKIIRIGREVIARRKDGSTFPADLAVSDFPDKDGPMFTGIIRDISERKEIERHLVESRLDEQRRIAQELHDGVGGMMTGIGMLAKSGQVALQREGSPHATLMAELVGHIRDAHEQLRQVAHGLAPIDVSPEGLGEALGELAARFNTEGLRCEFASDQPVAIHDSITAAQLYFIAQEAVSNAATHGKPSQITIRLTVENHLCTLTIADDGGGFEENPDSIEGMGLRTMRYRATLIGAAVLFRSTKGNGTMVACRFRNEPPNGPD